MISAMSPDRWRRCLFHRAAPALIAGVAVLLIAGCRTAPDATTNLSTAAPGSAELMDRYYLSTCARCEAALGSRGEAVARMREGRELRFCTEACAAEFDRVPARVIEAVDARMAADQAPHYPLQTCVVSGKRLPGRPLDVLWGNRLFRVAGTRERNRLLADPQRYLALLDDAVLAAQGPAYALPRKCPVQGDILRGDPTIDIVVANRMIRVCCTRCARLVRARPYQYLSMVDYANRAASNAAHRP